MAGSIRRRAKGTYELNYDVGVDPVSGKRQRHFKTVKGTRKEAEQVLAEVIRARDTGMDVPPSKITVADYFERWMRDYGETALARSTAERYRGIIRTHIVPELGRVRLQELRPTQVQAAYAKWSASGLSARTVAQHHHVLRRALSHAVRWQLLARNPADAVVRPRPEHYEMRALNPVEVSQLLKAIDDEDLKAIVVTALDTGMREGELLALTWKAVDLRAGTIEVLRSARYYAGEGIVTAQTKTHRSRRGIALAMDTVRLLQAHRARQAERRLQLGPAWSDNDLVFAGALGEPLPARNLYRRFSAVVSAAGLGKLRFHDLRHTSATLLLRAGVGAKVVSERLGHATVAFTLDTYAHVLPDMERDAADRLAAVIRGRA